MKYKWLYGENEYQKFYEAETNINRDRLLVFCNNWNPDIWFVSVCDRPIFNKTANDRTRKKYNLDKNCGIHALPLTTMLTSNDPNYLMKKAEWCYEHSKIEVSQ